MPHCEVGPFHPRRISRPSMQTNFEKHCKGNRYPTTLHLISSGIMKLGKLTTVGYVYRGMGSGLLPNKFWAADGRGSRAGVGFSFMSTTTNEEVALQYAQGKTPTVLRMRTGMVDKGADLSPLSQYPREKEVWWPPLTNLEVTGTSDLGVVLGRSWAVLGRSWAILPGLGKMNAHKDSARFSH